MVKNEIEELDNSGIEMLTVDIRDKAEEAFDNYAKELLLERAFPDYRDGLIPVQRRLLYGMYQMGLSYKSNGKPARQVKTARVVGDVMGKYHPHGDSGLSGAVARMAKDWVYLHPLTELIGNIGSSDGDREASMRYCVTGDTLVTLGDGRLVKIRNVVTDAKENSDNNISLGVKDYRGNTVNASKLFHSGRHPVKEITLKNGNRLEGTYNHPVLVVTKDNTGKPIFKWELMEDLKVGDYVVQLMGRDNTPREDLGKDMLATFLGGIISEGSTTQGVITFGNTDKEYYEEVIEFLEEDPTLKYREGVRKLKSGKDYYEFEVPMVSSRKIFESVSDIQNVVSKDKEIPEIILNGDRTRQVRFLQTLFTGDGTVTLTDKLETGKVRAIIEYSSISYKLVNQIQVLLFNYGVQSKIRKVGGRSEYKLHISGYRNVETFYHNIGFSEGDKSRKFKRWYKSDNVEGRNRSVIRSEKIPFVTDYLREEISTEVYKGKTEIKPQVRTRINKYNFDTIGNKNMEDNLPVMELIKEEFYDVWEFFRTDYIFTEITKVQENGVKPVYSLKVDTDDHSFITNGIVSHNTGIRLSEQANYLTEGLNKKGLVDWKLTYEDTDYEPKYLPAQYPNLLVNGSVGGIAIGYVVDILPHNLEEVLNVAIQDARGEELDPIAPDFPTGGVIVNGNELEEMYDKGIGRAVVRGRYKIETAGRRRKDKRSIVFYDVPYNVQKSKVVDKIQEMIGNNGSTSKQQLVGAIKVQDESGSDGLRIVVNVTDDADIEVVTELIYKYTQLERTQRYEFLTILDGQPTRMSLKRYIAEFNKFRRETIVREKVSDNNVIQTKITRLDALIKLDGIRDEVIQCIRDSENKTHARENLVERFEYTEEQAEYLLSLQLSRLTKDNYDKYRQDRDELQQLFDRNVALINSPEAINEYMVAEYEELIKKEGKPRQTDVQKEVREVDLTLERVIPLEDTVIGVTPMGHIKRSTTRSYGATKSVDFEVLKLKATTHDEVLVFTDLGQVGVFKVNDIPEMRWGEEGEPLVTFARDYHIDERVIGIGLRDKLNNLIFITNDNRVKVMLPTEFDFRTTNVFYNILPIEREKDERVLGVSEVEDNTTVVITSTNKRKTLNYGLAFKAGDINPTGRSAKGRKLASWSKSKVFEDIYLSGELEEEDYREVGRAPVKDVFPVDIDLETIKDSNFVSETFKITNEPEPEEDIDLEEELVEEQEVEAESEELESEELESEE